ncbi:MAG: DNA repair protein RecO [Chloroflexi bacterium]|nr:MAG: DNA repair protein RecO [Chloroflexota bacterium]
MGRDAPSEQFESAQQQHRARLYRSNAIILRRRDTGEADRILTLLTEAHGKTRVVAKGVRRPGSRMAGHLEPFSVVQILVARTRGLDIVSQAELRSAFSAMRQSERAVSTAGYFGELLDLLLPEEQVVDGVFPLATAALELLDQGYDPRSVAFVFEMGLLRCLGYRPRVDRCIVCDAVLQPVSNAFSVEGGLVCQGCALARHALIPLSVNAQKLLRLVDRGEIEPVLRLRVGAAVWSELAVVVHTYIARIAGRELSAPRVIHELRLD